MVADDRAAAALQVVAELLRRYGSPHATAVDRLLASRTAAAAAADDLLWAEDGGLWDTGPQVLQRPHDDPQRCRDDELAYRQAFADLLAAASEVAAAEQVARMREVVDTFRAWTERGL